jgi:hypothetical protein
VLAGGHSDQPRSRGVIDFARKRFDILRDMRYLLIRNAERSRYTARPLRLVRAERRNLSIDFVEVKQARPSFEYP